MYIRDPWSTMTDVRMNNWLGAVPARNEPIMMPGLVAPGTTLTNLPTTTPKPISLPVPMPQAPVETQYGTDVVHVTGEYDPAKVNMGLWLIVGLAVAALFGVKGLRR